MDLPWEILTEIVKSCDGISFIRFGKTCSVYRILLDDNKIWHHLVINDFKKYVSFFPCIFSELARYKELCTFNKSQKRSACRLGRISLVRRHPSLVQYGYIEPKETPESEPCGLSKQMVPPAKIKLTQRRVDEITGKKPKWMRKIGFKPF